MNRLTRSVHDKITRAFIDENPGVFRFVRRDQIATEDGGHSYGPPRPLSPQKGREIRRNRDTSNRTIPDGNIVVPEYVLVFEAGANVEIGDTVELGIVVYQVAMVHRGNWSTNVEVARYGRN